MLEIINQRYMKFLFIIERRPRNISELAKKGDLTLSVASTLISRWAREGVVFKKRSEGGRGKEIIIYLTEYGEAQVKLLKQLYENHKEKKPVKIHDEIELKTVSLVKDPPDPNAVITVVSN
ncbi:hypothetical protein LCGC14_2418360, partial [marine sediment metagenome]